MTIRTMTPNHVVAQIKGLLTRSQADGPAFTMVLGAGFSYGLVPLTSAMMREEIGPWSRNESSRDKPVEARRKQSAAYWQEFNLANEAAKTGHLVELDDEGLPKDPTAAYQTISTDTAVHGLGSVREARRFLRAMVGQSSGRLNGAHFFLAALLEAQQRREVVGGPFCRTIFTTNFDPLLQTSLQLAGVLYYMTDRPELDLDSAQLREQDDAVHLVYTHGNVHRPYLANSKQELDILCAANARVFQPYLQDHGVIVIGYSGWEDTLMKALAACTNFECNLYWCDVFAASEAEMRLSRPAREFLTSSRGRRFYVSLGQDGADGFMSMLFQALTNQGIPRLLLDPFSERVNDFETPALGN